MQPIRKTDCERRLFSDEALLGYESGADFINAGCVALAAGSSLLNREVLKNNDWKKLSATAAAFVAAVKNARAKKG